MSLFFTQPFTFYGGYTALTTKERVHLAEDKVVNYYRACVIELEEKNRVLESEITILKDMNMKYSSELTILK
jgi:hypothetical protein